jgi:hypothetical protein
MQWNKNQCINVKYQVLLVNKILMSQSIINFLHLNWDKKIKLCLQPYLKVTKGHQNIYNPVEFFNKEGHQSSPY